MHKRTVSPVREAIKTALREQARQLGPGGKLPTVVDLCGQLGVAKATINSALGELQAEGILRRRRGSGIYVTPRIDQKTVGLVFGGDVFRVGVSPVYALLIDRCRERAASHGEHFSFFFNLRPTQTAGESIPVHQDLAEAIAGGRLHGIILGTGVGESEEEWLLSQKVPVVGATSPLMPHRVVIDYAELIRLGVEALARQGCRRLGFITPFGRWRQTNLPDRDFDLHAFASALKTHGLPCRPEWLWEHRTPPGQETILHEEQGCQAVLDLFAAGQGEWPDSLLIADDMMTRGALVGLRRRGLTPGKEVKIATHANRGSPTLYGYEDVLTRIEVDVEELVEKMFDLLERLMAGETVDTPMPVVTPRLVAAGGQGTV